MGQYTTANKPASGEPNIRQLPPRRRHKFLRGRYRWNCMRCQPPYNEVSIYYVEDLKWIARKRGWRIITLSPEGGRLQQFRRSVASWSRREPTRGNPPNLSGAVFDHVDLSHLNLSEAKLEGATFTEDCQLKGTKLINADLRGAHFGNIDLSDTVFLDRNQEDALRAQLPASPGSSSTGRPVNVNTRNELLWIISRGYDLRAIDLNLRGAKVYERDLAGLKLRPDCVASPEAIALATSIETNLAHGDPPFCKVTVHSWRDLFWLKLALQIGILRSDITREVLSDLRDAEMADSDFCGADLFKADLRNANLSRAMLDAADLSYARLNPVEMSLASARGASLDQAKLVDAHLFNARLERASLLEANLRGARLDDAFLCGAILSVADLRATTFRDAHLECVDFRGAWMNAATSFIDSTINKGTQWGDVVFLSTPLLEINWRNAKRLGDESILFAYEYLKRSDVRNGHYRDVMRAYRQMYTKLREQGFNGPARWYRLREKALLRRQLRENHYFLGWLYSWLANFLFGYGEQPQKLFIPYFLVIGLFTAIYYALAHRILPFLPDFKPDQLSWFQAAVLSVSTLRGQPSFPSDLLQQRHIGTLLSAFGGAETAIGTIILLAMSLLWTQHLLGNETPPIEAHKRRWTHRIAEICRRRPAQKCDVEPRAPQQDTS